jgi:hypothetical protein
LAAKPTREERIAALAAHALRVATRFAQEDPRRNLTLERVGA